MVLLRRVIGDALRARRQGQRRTLREVSTAANVSLGYLSEIERGQKEPSSELLAAVCDALGTQLSDVLRQVSDSLATAEEMEQVLAPIPGPDATERVSTERVPVRAIRLPRPAEPVRQVTRDGEVTVSVRHDTPLRTTLRARPRQAGDREREVVYA